VSWEDADHEPIRYTIGDAVTGEVFASGWLDEPRDHPWFTSALHVVTVGLAGSKWDWFAKRERWVSER
jgi:hypothetical protein